MPLPNVEFECMVLACRIPWPEAAFAAPGTQLWVSRYVRRRGIRPRYQWRCHRPSCGPARRHRHLFGDRQPGRGDGVCHRSQPRTHSGLDYATGARCWLETRPTRTVPPCPAASRIPARRPSLPATGHPRWRVATHPARSPTYQLSQSLTRATPVRLPPDQAQQAPTGLTERSRTTQRPWPPRRRGHAGFRPAVSGYSAVQPRVGPV
jgi:hypothetical protein